MIDTEKMNNFHITVKPSFELIDLKAKENKNLEILRETLLSKMATIWGRKMKQFLDVENFIKIYYDENRKGDYLDGRFTEFSELKDLGTENKTNQSKF